MMLTKKLTRHSSYDYESAQFKEWYCLWELMPTFWGKLKWRRVRVTSYALGDMYTTFVQGDRYWAARIAKDLNIEMPEATGSEVF